MKLKNGRGYQKLPYLLVLLLLAMVSVPVVAAIYYYYGLGLLVSPEAPKIEFLQGDDITATINPTNRTWAQLTVDKLQPNATVVYTSALKFRVLSAGTVKLQIASVSDSNSIIWGLRLYVFKTGASTYSLTLVDGGEVTVGSTDGNAPLMEVGYRQSGAPSGYGGTSLPQESSAISASANDTYVIVIEIYGKDGILSSQSATLSLKLIWY